MIFQYILLPKQYYEETTRNFPTCYTIPCLLILYLSIGV
jgi:hypothetical protein